MFAHLSLSWTNVSPGGIHGRTFGCSIKYQEAHFLSSFPAAQFVLHLESRRGKLFPFSSSSSKKKPNGGRPTMQMKHLGQEKAQWNYTALNKNEDFSPQREVMVRNRGIKILPLWGNAKFCIKNVWYKHFCFWFSKTTSSVTLISLIWIYRTCKLALVSSGKRDISIMCSFLVTWLYIPKKHHYKSNVSQHWECKICFSLWNRTIYYWS